MKKTWLYEVTNAQFDNLLCGNCKSIILGYDEEICPCCGAYIDMDDIVAVSQQKVKHYLNRHK